MWYKCTNNEIMYVQKCNRCFNNNNLSSFKTIIEKDYLVEHDIKPNET